MHCAQDLDLLAAHMSDAEDSDQVSSTPAPLCFLFDGCLEQVLRWLPIQHALRTARTSKAFERASAASIKGVGWDAPPAAAATAATAVATATATPFGVYGRIDGALDAIQGEEGETVLHCGLGTPCLDLRAAGDAVDCAALVHLLQIAFKSHVSANRVANATGAGPPSGSPRVPKELGSNHVLPVLKGLAVHSLAIRTKVSDVQSSDPRTSIPGTTGLIILIVGPKERSPPELACFPLRPECASLPLEVKLAPLAACCEGGHGEASTCDTTAASPSVSGRTTENWQPATSRAAFGSN